MTATYVEPELDRTDGDDDPGMVHIVCCDPDLALCGEEIPGDDGWVPEDTPTECVVCADLKDLPCHDPYCPGPM